MKSLKNKVWLGIVVSVLFFAAFLNFTPLDFFSKEESQHFEETTVASDVTENKVTVGGASVGIIMRTDGVMVVGYSALKDENGAMVYPAKDGGIALGDSILRINGETVTSDDTLLELVDAYGQEGALRFDIRHGDRLVKKDITPIYCQETGRYRVGLYVRDQLGGIGTLTLYDPMTNRFAALGHPVEGTVEAAADGLLGRVLPSGIRGIHKAAEGEVGEMIGSFEAGTFRGGIDKVGQYGVYGSMEGGMESYLTKDLPIAKADEIQEGSAEIITVLKGNQQESFDIEILSVDAKDTSGKGLTIEITDSRLLSETGGIIQGMSGSPIIQKGKLVGAVTYVMVNHPQKGYGCCIEYIYKEMLE